MKSVLKSLDDVSSLQETYSFITFPKTEILLFLNSFHQILHLVIDKS